MDALMSALLSASDTLHEGLIITDAKLNVLFANRRALDLLQVTDRELKRRPLNWVTRDFSKGAEALELDTPLLEQHFSYQGQELSVSYYPGMNSATGEGYLCVQINDLSTHQTLKARENSEQFHLDVLDAIMNTVNDWIVIVDRNGIVTTMSRSYKEFLRQPNPEGRHVSEVIENTRMHHVIETGIAETDQVQRVQGNKMIASRYPILSDGKVVGAMGKAVFKDIDDFYTLYNKLSKLQTKTAPRSKDVARETTARYSFDNIIGRSPSTRQAVHLAQKASRTDSNVLIIGESGTGKELFAHAIHNAGNRRSEPFIMLNCAAIPSELLESELFGYEQGAFTGANRQGKRGKFEMAHRGTIFLDEIGDMPLDMQAKLLRVLQEKEIDRVGGSGPIPVDVRVIAATNREIEALVDSGTFRKDLYYRLNVMRINLAPLRERREEIPEIAEVILRKLATRMELIMYGFTPGAMARLSAYDWPGNIRELENVLERALNLLEDDLYIKESLLPEGLLALQAGALSTSPAATLPTVPAGRSDASAERDQLLQVLSTAGGNKKKAAEALGLSRAGLYKKMARLGIPL